MTQKIYIVEGRQFRSEADYQNALKDQQVIENLRMQTKKMSGISGVNLYELSLHHFNYILSSITFPYSYFYFTILENYCKSFPETLTGSPAYNRA